MMSSLKIGVHPLAALRKSGTLQKNEWHWVGKLRATQRGTRVYRRKWRSGQPAASGWSPHEPNSRCVSPVSVMHLLRSAPIGAGLRDKIKFLPTMERASKLIRGLRLSGDAITPEQLCCAAWPEAVGKKIAGHTRPAKLVRTRMVVEVEDHTWQRQLFTLTPHILNNLEKTLGPGDAITPEQLCCA